MITTIRGILEYSEGNIVVVTIGAISLRIEVPTSTLANLGSVGEPVHLHTYLHVREDALTLYGFFTSDTRRIFEHLIGVNGVGPRMAISILSILSPSDVVSAVTTDDFTTLARVPGVGQKLANRLVLELREKLEKEWGMVHTDEVISHEGDVFAALVALGYSSTEARQASGRLDSSTRALSVEEQVRRALQGMGF